MSIDARGKLADSLVFGGWKGIAWCREYFVPQNPQSADQVALRLIFSQSVESWHNDVDSDTKDDWQTAIENKGETMSGFNFFVSEYILSMRNGETPSITPPAHLL